MHSRAHSRSARLVVGKGGGLGVGKLNASGWRESRLDHTGPSLLHSGADPCAEVWKGGKGVWSDQPCTSEGPVQE